MNGEPWWEAKLKRIQDPYEFAVPLPLHAAGDDGAIMDVQGGVHRGGRAAEVMMLRGARLARPCRDLTLLVQTDHQRICWRLEVEAEDPADLPHKFGVTAWQQRRGQAQAHPVRPPDLTYYEGG